MKNRVRFTGLLFLFAFLILIARLFYWQIIHGKELAARADSQYFDSLELPAARGDIVGSDKSVLAGSLPTFLLYIYKPNLKTSIAELANKLSDVLLSSTEQNPKSIDAADLKKSTHDQIITKLSRDSVWELIGKKLTQDQKSQIESWHESGIGFESSSSRFYPDASESAHILGFVGSDVTGKPKGYFGLEGFYDRELAGVPGILKQEKDALGNPILVGNFQEIGPQQGRTLTTHIDRYVQKIVEEALKDGMDRYQASAGEAVLMEPKTGAIIADASFPNYDPQTYWQFDPSSVKDASISESYEPGSTFKVLVMAAALDTQAVSPDTRCDACNGPVTIGKYTIRTWNNQYQENPTMTDVIIHSNNVGMVFVSRKLGEENMVDYIKRFGIGERTGIDLQGEASPKLREKWGDIDLATSSFGQGIAVTTMQMLRAVGAIANGGLLMTPQVVSTISGEKDSVITPVVARRVISSGTASKMTEMMVRAVSEGEAKFAAPKEYRVAGKTGTAQIPVAGHYDSEKTIASFVGFAPADDPKFVMIVKLREPKSSPWGSETAAPLWFSIAKKLFVYWGIPPSE